MSQLIVQKYGGSSVADAEKIKSVARRVAESAAKGHRMVVVVSAMGKTTDALVALAHAITPAPDPREMDTVLATGEQVTIGLLAMALHSMGHAACSFTGPQVGMVTDGAHTRARIRRITAERIHAALEAGKIVVVAGFQGMTESGDITTLGRGGSDLTGVALAAALKADVCEIFTDVDGVYTADPNAVPEHVRSTFKPDPGTLVTREDHSMEDVVVTGITHDRGQAKLSILRVPDRPGIASQVFGGLAKEHIVVDMIVQNIGRDGSTDISFTLPRGDRQRAETVLAAVAKDIGAAGVTADDRIARVSIVGVGMRSHSGVAARMFATLSNENINIQMISTSEIAVSCIIEDKYAELAVRALHDAFELGKEPAA